MINDVRLLPMRQRRSIAACCLLSGEFDEPIEQKAKLITVECVLRSSTRRLHFDAVRFVSFRVEAFSSLSLSVLLLFQVQTIIDAFVYIEWHFNAIILLVYPIGMWFNINKVRTYWSSVTDEWMNEWEQQMCSCLRALLFTNKCRRKNKFHFIEST